MAAAGESIKQLANAPSDTPDADLKRLMAGSYRSFAELAEEITLLNDTPENTKAARAASLALLQSNVVGMRKLNLLGRMASFGMNSPHRKGNGVVLAARVDETAPEGKLFRTRVKLLGLDLPDSISILSAEDPQVKPTDTIVLLGSIVAAPTINLHDYSGTEDSVIWATAIGPAQLEP
jgi:hypothetical protein